MPSVGNSFTFGTYYLGDYGVFLMDHDYEGIADPEVEVRVSSAVHGGVSVGERLGSKSFTLPCVIYADSYLELRQTIDLLKSILNPTTGEKYLITDYELQLPAKYRRGRYCRLSQSFTPELRGNSYQLDLTFISSQASAFGAEITESQSWITTQPKTLYFPEDAAGVVNGNNYARPVWTLTNSTGSPQGYVLFENITTGDSFSWGSVVELADGQALQVDTWRQHIRFSTLGVWYQGMQALSSDATFPRLLPGARNEIKVTGIATGSLSVVYRPEWL